MRLLRVQEGRKERRKRAQMMLSRAVDFGDVSGIRYTIFIHSRHRSTYREPSNHNVNMD